MEHEDLFSSLFEIMAIFGSTKNLNPEDMNGFKKLTQSLNTAIIAKSGDTKNIDMRVAVLNAYFDVYSDESSHAVFIEMNCLEKLKECLIYFKSLDLKS